MADEQEIKKYISKVIYGGEVLMDLTGDTVDAGHLLSGFTAHDKTGAPVEGACTFDSDTSDATAAVAELLEGKTAYARGAKITGAMRNNEDFSGTIASVDDAVTIPVGYHDGSGTVDIDADEKAKIVAVNIRAGVTILGVEGEMSGTEDVKAQSTEVTASLTEDKVITPDTTQGYNYLAQVTVKKVPLVYADNAAGGQTVTIG